MVKFGERNVASGFGHETSLGFGQTLISDCKDKVGGGIINVRQTMMASFGIEENKTLNMFVPLQLLLLTSICIVFCYVWKRKKKM